MARPGLNKPRTEPDRLRPDGAMVTYLCNLLDDNDEKPWRVLKAAGLTPQTHADWYLPEVVLYTAARNHMPPALDSSEDADASDAQSEDDDSDAD